MCTNCPHSLEPYHKNTVCEAFIRSSFVPKISTLSVIIRKTIVDSPCDKREFWFPVGAVYSENTFPTGTTFEIRFYAHCHRRVNILDSLQPACCKKMLYNGSMTSISMNCDHFSCIDQDAVNLGELIVEDQTTHRTGTTVFRFPLKRLTCNRSPSVQNLWTIQSLYDLATLYGQINTIEQWKQLASHLGFMEEEINQLVAVLRQTSSLDETSSPITPKRAFCLLYHCFQRQGGTPVQFIRGLRAANKKHSFDYYAHNPSQSWIKPTESVSSPVTSTDSKNIVSSVKESQFTCLCDDRVKENEQQKCDLNPHLRPEHSVLDRSTIVTQNYNSKHTKDACKVSKDKSVHSIRQFVKRDNLRVNPSSESSRGSTKKSWLKEAKRCRSTMTLNVSDLLSASKSNNHIPDLTTPVKRVSSEQSHTFCEEFQIRQPSAKKARTSEYAPGTSHSITVENKIVSTPKRNKTGAKRKRSRCIDAFKSTKQCLLPNLWHPRLVGQNKSPTTILSAVRTKLEETRQQTAEFHYKLNELMNNLDGKNESGNCVPRIPNASSPISTEIPVTQRTLTDARLWRLASFFEHTEAPNWKRLIEICGLVSDELIQQIEQTTGKDMRIAVYLVLLCWLEKQSNPSSESLPSLNDLFTRLKSEGFEKFVSHCVCNIERMNIW